MDADGRHNGREIGSFDAVLAQNLAAFFGPRSVLDLGCGLGEYGRAFQELVRTHSDELKLHRFV